MRKFVFGGSYASAVPLLLDLYPATAAYSLRKLRNGYTGSAIRVRRSSDNTEQDIGFVGNDLDTASLSSFVGANDGFVTTWYDQSGNSNNMTQASASLQPLMVVSGTLQTKGSKPAMYVDSDNMGAGNIPAFNTYPFSYWSVAAGFALNTLYGLFRTDNNSRIAAWLDTRTSPIRNLNIETSTGSFFGDLSTAYNNTNQRILSGIIDSSFNYQAYDNGNTGGSGTATGTYLNNDLRIYQQRVQSFKGYGQEFIFFSTDESANRTAIESNINGYYGIY